MPTTGLFRIAASRGRVLRIERGKHLAVDIGRQAFLESGARQENVVPLLDSRRRQKLAAQSRKNDQSEACNQARGCVRTLPPTTIGTISQQRRIVDGIVDRQTDDDDGKDERAQPVPSAAGSVVAHCGHRSRPAAAPNRPCVACRFSPNPCRACKFLRGGASNRDPIGDRREQLRTHRAAAGVSRRSPLRGDCARRQQRRTDRRACPR